MKPKLSLLLLAIVAAAALTATLLAGGAPKARPLLGTVSGTVSFTGAAPAGQVIQMSADPFCLSAHQGEEFTTQQVVVNANNTLRWVFIYVKEGLGGQGFDPPAEPVTLNQQGCVYAPHVVGVQTGQTLRITNSDNTLHNVHAYAENNPDFNVAQPIPGMSTERSFANPEVMVTVKCDVHPWMESFVAVVAHPYFTVSDETGAFTLPDLPPGDYVIEAWHETLGAQTRNVTVSAGGAETVDFGFGAQPDA